MILNISRAKNILACEQKEHFREIGRMVPLREAEPLMTGGAYHEGSAVLFATGSKEKAVAATEKFYRERLEGQVILDVEKPFIEQEIEVAKIAVAKYADYHPKEDFTVLMPEVKFVTQIPGTEHHCWYCHKVLHPNDPYSREIDSCSDPRCIQPHYLKGRADAVLQWKSMIWLFEQKTSGMNQAIWWKQWYLDLQLTGYLYGVWKATGIRPQGVLLNKIRKPRKNESFEKWQEDENLFTREPFLRSEKDLARFEIQFTRIANRYEHVMKTGEVILHPQECISWNRECEYMSLCTDHQQEDWTKFRRREDDYVDEEYYSLLGLENPNKKGDQASA